MGPLKQQRSVAIAKIHFNISKHEQAQIYVGVSVSMCLSVYV